MLSSPDEVIAIASAVGVPIGFASMIWAWRSARSSDRDSAREEAESLAATRGEVIDDLQEQINQVRDDLSRTREERQTAVKRLAKEIEEVKDEAHATQRMLVTGFRGVLHKLVDHLQASPPEVDQAIAVLRDTLSEPRTARSPRHRRSQ